MKQKRSQIIAVWMALLIVLAPFVYADIPETTGGQLTLTASVPQATKDNKITVTGTTSPDIQVEIILNQARVAQTTSDAQGNFETSPITLVRENNTIQVKATDATGNVKVLTYNVDIDMKPPAVNYGQIPAGIQTRALTLTGSSNEPITLKYRLNSTLNYTSLGQMSTTFTASIDLQDGMNKLELLAEDRAGNADTQVFDITYDIVKPSFTTTNLNNLEPCYFDYPLGLGKKVAITGQTSEKTTLYVYLNHETTPKKVSVSRDDGGFRIDDILLTNKVKIQNITTQTTYEYGDKYENHIKLVAKDLAGNEEIIEKTVTCGTCGGGASGYTFTTGEIYPKYLSPALLVRGMEMITIPINATYRGLNKARLGSITASKPILAPEFEDDYDNDQIQSVTPLLQRTNNQKDAAGVLQIQIPAFDPLGAAETDAEYGLREYNVSTHRWGTCGLIPGEPRGCMKFFLILNINYQEETPTVALDPNTQETITTIKQQTQKVCIAPISIDIDQVTPPDMTPRKMVNEGLNWVNQSLQWIQKIKDPLAKTQEYLTYSCIATIGTVMLVKLTEITSCTIGSAISKIGDTPWHEEIAETGMCEDVYSEKFDQEKDNGPGIKGNERVRRSCMWCQNTLALRKWLQYEVMNRVCDRVGCPAAKTFKSYIGDKTGNVHDITTTITAYLDKVTISASDKSAEATTMLSDAKAIEEKIFKENGVPIANPATRKNRQIYTGSDCGFTENPKYITMTYSDLPPAKGIKTLYQLSSSNLNRDKCVSYIRGAKPECCGIEYNREWSTACGLGQISSTNIPLLDTFDELEESTCLAARNAGQPEDMSCGTLWNSLAGFCEPHTGAARSEIVHTAIPYKPLKQDSTDNIVYVFVVPKETKQEVTDYEVKRGYALKTIVYNKNQTEYNKKGARELTQSLYEVHDMDLTKYFTETQESLKQNEEQKIAAFKEALCKTDVDQSECTMQRARRAYERIKEITQTTEDQYIVRPDTGILRAIQCLCIPAVVAWVQEWEGILTMLKQCLTTVKLGKGDAGVCQTFYSTAICDRIYDLIKCFTNKFGMSGPGKRVTGDMGIGSVIGILTNTASEMSATVKGRYGDSGMWNAMFNEKAIVNGVCLWAFTGKWNLEMTQVIQQTATQTAPIESTALITECKKYFRGFSPQSQPAGLTTWAYECPVMLVAGANINYRLKLRCSETMQCLEADGYRNGECDCFKTGEKTITIPEATGTLEQGGFLNKNIVFQIQAGQGGSELRYDTAILEYEWEDPKTKQKRTGTAERYITQAGAVPFSYCGVDWSGTFRCQYGTQESGISITSNIKPIYENKHPDTGIPAFGRIGNNGPFESFVFEIKVRQTMPDALKDQLSAKKFLYYTIYNQFNKPVYGTNASSGTSPYVFESNGDYTKIITIDDIPMEKIENKLTELPGEDAIGWKKEDGSAGEKTDANEYIFSYEIKENGESIPAVIAMTDETISVYRAQGKTAALTGFTKGEILVKNDTYNSGTKYTAQPRTRTNNYAIDIDITRAPESGELVEIYLPKKTAPITTQIKGTPQEWKIDIEIHEADKYGGPSEQISISPDGNLQKRSARFKVMDAAGIERTAETTAAAAQAGAVAGAQAAAQVPDQFVHYMYDQVYTGAINFINNIKTEPELYNKLSTSVLSQRDISSGIGVFITNNLGEFTGDHPHPEFGAICMFSSDSSIGPCGKRLPAEFETLLTNPGNPLEFRDSPMSFNEFETEFGKIITRYGRDTLISDVHEKLSQIYNYQQGVRLISPLPSKEEWTQKKS